MKLEPSTGNKTFLLLPALNKSIQTQPSTVNAAEKDNNKKREREREREKNDKRVGINGTASININKSIISTGRGGERDVEGTRWHGRR